MRHKEQKMAKISFEIEKEYESDVLVIGGGVAGLSAAVAAARSGARVLLCEQNGYLGGTATAGMVSTFMTCLDAKGEKQIIKGFYEEFVQYLVSIGGAVYHDRCPGNDSYSGYRTKGHIGVTPFDGEAFKLAAEHFCDVAGVELLYHALFVDCEVSDGKVKTAYFATPGGIVSVRAKIFVDASGSAQLVYKAGGETVRGDSDGEIQTASLFFTIDGVDKAALDAYMAEHPEMPDRFYMNEIAKARDGGRFPCGTAKLRIFELPNGQWNVNMAQVDGEVVETDAENLTKSEKEQRIQISKIFEFLKTEIPALKNIRMVSTAPAIGVRESRRIVGKHVMTLEDMQNHVRFDDRIAVCANSVDIHLKFGNKYIAFGGESYYIPLSSLLPRELCNVIVPGKCLSADRFAHSAVRVMPPCFAMGEAAGYASALAAKDGSFDCVDAGAVQKMILDNGGYLG